MIRTIALLMSMATPGRALGAAAALILGSCSCSETPVDAPPEDPDPPSGVIPFEIITQGIWGVASAPGPEWTDTGLLVIEDDSSWLSFWTRNGWDPPVPAIDFTTHTVLAVIDIRRVQAASVEVTDLVSSEDVLAVRVVRWCGPFPVVTFPFQVIVLEGHGWVSYVLDLAGDPCPAYPPGGSANY